MLSVGSLKVSSSSHSVPDSMEKKHPNRKRMQKTAKKSQALESDRLNFLSWNQAVTGDEPLAFLSGGKEGGFLSLEEIDESEYGFIGGTHETGERNKKGSSTTSSNSKKRKRGKSNAEAEEDVPCVVQEVHGANETDCDSVEGNAEECNATNAESDIEEEPLLGEDEIYAWNDLRLHPLLLKSIRRLGFKEPTPIQKACIPIASHQGKDVIGAAQTGSGKTLAFGLPILQRLLEEREKTRRSLQNDIEVTVGSEKSFLRALILVPTRELALQAMDRFRSSEHGVLIATDVAARGLDIPGIRTVVHYQLPHSAEVYIHRSGRTARASSDGCSIALISPNDQAKFSSLCKSLSKDSFQEFRVDTSYMPDILKRLSLARQIDKIQRTISQNGVSPLVQKQLEQFSKAKLTGKMGCAERKTRGLVVIGQDCVEPLQALRDSGHEVFVNTDREREARQRAEKWKNKRREEKKRDHDRKRKVRKERKKARYGEK